MWLETFFTERSIGDSSFPCFLSKCWFPSLLVCLMLKSSGVSLSSASAFTCGLVEGDRWDSGDAWPFKFSWPREWAAGGWRATPHFMLSVYSGIPSSEHRESASSSAAEKWPTLIKFSVWLLSILGWAFWTCRMELSFVQNTISQSWHLNGLWRELSWVRRWFFKERKYLKSTLQYLQTVSGEWKLSRLVAASRANLFRYSDLSISSRFVLPCFFLK